MVNWSCRARKPFKIYTILTTEGTYAITLVGFWRSPRHRFVYYYFIDDDDDDYDDDDDDDDDEDDDVLVPALVNQPYTHNPM